MTVRAAFHVFDKDGSGALSTDELKAVLTRPGGGQPLSDEEVADIIKEFDINGDVRPFCTHTQPASAALVASTATAPLPPSHQPCNAAHPRTNVHAFLPHSCR